MSDRQASGFIKPDSTILLKQHPFVTRVFWGYSSWNRNYRKDKQGRKYIEPKFAHKYYDEISVGIDFTARDVQANLKAKKVYLRKQNHLMDQLLLVIFFAKKSSLVH
jgi:hypothetical protein